MQCLRSDLAAKQSKAVLAAFYRDESGASFVLFAMTMMVMVGAAALVLDYGHATKVHARQQAALDAATLAASDVLGTTDAQDRGDNIAGAFYNANTKRNPDGTISKLNLDTGTGQVSATGDTPVDTWLMRVFGVKQIPVKARTVIARATGTVEVALVLDNSGSMSSEMDTLKTAAKEMAGILFVGAEGTEKVRVGLVPFAASVNVGPAKAWESWIDSGGASPVHHENTNGTYSRFALFDAIGVPWAGCVEVRPAPYDVNDALPVAATPATLFVPMFAPDEPDPVNSDGQTYPNSYLRDDGGSCPRQERICTSYSRRGNCQDWRTVPISPDVAQRRVCKYNGQTAYYSSGPNYNCTTAAILPLTSTKSELVNAIDGMVANGWTNILQGTTWGWRVLSSAQPFAEGRSESDGDNQKFLVIMSDGENTYQTRSNHNKSMYGAFGYTAKGRLPELQPASTMTTKTLTACSNAKAAGITIFTVAFRDAVTSSAARDLLQSCASHPSQALLASDGPALKKAFENIGRQITQLRIAG